MAPSHRAHAVRPYADQRSRNPLTLSLSKGEVRLASADAGAHNKRLLVLRQAQHERVCCLASR